MTTPLETIINQAKEALRSTNPNPETAESLIYDIAFSYVPDHAEDRLHVASYDLDIMTDAPEDDTPFNEALNPTDMIASNIFSSIRRALRTHYFGIEDPGLAGVCTPVKIMSMNPVTLRAMLTEAIQNDFDLRGKIEALTGFEIIWEGMSTLQYALVAEAWASLEYVSDYQRRAVLEIVDTFRYTFEDIRGNI